MSRFDLFLSAQFLFMDPYVCVCVCVRVRVRVRVRVSVLTETIVTWVLKTNPRF